VPQSPTYYKVVFSALFISCIVAAIYSFRRQRKSDFATSKLGLTRATKRKFNNSKEKAKFSCMQSWSAPPRAHNFYHGTISGFDTFVFSLANTRTTSVITVLLKSNFNHLPHFIIKPKSFTEEVGDMLGIRKHHPLYPFELIDKYDVSSDDDAKFASILTPEIIGYFFENEGVWVEVLRGHLMVRNPILDDPENYEIAINKTLCFAHLLGVNLMNVENSYSNNGADTDAAKSAAQVTP